jgi:hypothetical protein
MMADHLIVSYSVRKETTEESPPKYLPVLERLGFRAEESGPGMRFSPIRTLMAEPGVVGALQDGPCHGHGGHEEVVPDEIRFAEGAK